jgi:hypothetical protein
VLFDDLVEASGRVGVVLPLLPDPSDYPVCQVRGDARLTVALQAAEPGQLTAAVLPLLRRWQERIGLGGDDLIIGALARLGHQGARPIDHDEPVGVWLRTQMADSWVHPTAQILAGQPRRRPGRRRAATGRGLHGWLARLDTGVPLPAHADLAAASGSSLWGTRDLAAAAIARHTAPAAARAAVTVRRHAARRSLAPSESEARRRKPTGSGSVLDPPMRLMV